MAQRSDTPTSKATGVRVSVVKKRRGDGEDDDKGDDDAEGTTTEGTRTTAPRRR